MDIQEAIQHCMDVAAGATEQGKCPECAADHEQLAGWLTVLKQIAEIFNCDPQNPYWVVGRSKLKCKLYEEAKRG